MGVLCVGLEVRLIVVEAVGALGIEEPVAGEDEAIGALDERALEPREELAPCAGGVLVVRQQRVDVDLLLGLRVEELRPQERVGGGIVVVGLLAACRAVEVRPVGRERELLLLGEAVAVVRALTVAQGPLLYIVIACLEDARERVLPLVELGARL